MLELTDVRMPHMGSVEFALLTEWLIKPGETVAEGDALCEVSTDKVDTEVESPAAGILIEYVAEVDQEVPVGEVIARFAPAGTAPEAVAHAISGAPEPELASGTATGAAEALISAPAAPGGTAFTPGTLAAGQAPAGSPVPSVVQRAAVPQPPDRIESRPPNDSLVLAASWITHVNRPPAGARRVPQGASPAPESRAEVTARPRAGEPVRPAGYENVGCAAIEHTRLRRAIARNLSESWNNAPQLTAQLDVDFTAVSVARAKINRRRVAAGQRTLSFLPFVAVALCRTVAAHPVVNATFTDTHLLQWQPINLAIAVDTPDGLVVPVVHDAGALELEELAEAITRIGDATASGTARPEDLAGGTITISNSGSVGGVISTPILTRPQVASLGLPAIVRTPVARRSADGSSELLAIRPVARLGLTFDHRAFDGAQALRALADVQRTLETWPAGN
ncbi:dihydrolipoamide acetyltransferase family protein [Nocardia sp. NPDC050697]|uniref:dihydrolipoamide acetyltransferase family protein n=1 Tax=Nocardia sp. NPDC050697 TaxID=3155158 RepID=UPI0033FE7FB5